MPRAAAMASVFTMPTSIRPADSRCSTRAPLFMHGFEENVPFYSDNEAGDRHAPSIEPILSRRERQAARFRADDRILALRKGV